MRIQLFSDLHLERYPDFQPQILPGTDVVVLAGDIGSYQPGSRLLTQDFGLERFSPLLVPALAQAQVLFIPGNHEFDALDYEATYARLQETCTRLGITWLDREIVTIDNVRFIGTTLWSDFDALVEEGAPLTKQLQQRTKAFRAANYYLSKNTTIKDVRPGCALRWPRRSRARRSSSRILPRASRAPTRATARRPAPPASAIRSMNCSSARRCGCMATCIARTTTWSRAVTARCHGAAASSPIRSGI
jgi:hypothetical protein